MKPTIFFAILLSLILPVLQASGIPPRPNILWISCEDISSHLSCYGSADAITPNLDMLAKRGVRFTHTFTTCPVCATNRSSIITGMYPTSIGTHLMRCQAKLPDNIQCFTKYLRDAGYHCTNNAKTDYNFVPAADSLDDSSPQAHWRKSQINQPFFHVRNFTNTHESRIWPRGKAHARQTTHLKPEERQDPSKVELPPYYSDTPETRRDWANYLENITEMDYRVGELLQQLEDDGLAEDTIVIFWSDHGVGLPRGKRWLYDSGTRVPYIVYVPEKFRINGQGKPGTVSDELISFIDLAPTVLSLAGVTIPKQMQGRAHLGPNLSAERDYLVSTRDRMDERYDIIRSLRDKRWRYTRNYMPWKPYTQWLNYAETNETMKALRRIKSQKELPSAAKLFMSERKPREELYDTEADPHEIHNLAHSTKLNHQQVLKQMRSRLDDWQAETVDLGFLTEVGLGEGALQHGSRYEILRQADGPERAKQLRDIVIACDHRDLAAFQVGLKSPDAMIRRWAVVGYGLLDLESLRESEVLKAMQLAAKDKHPIVRIAAAENLCKMGPADMALPLLTAELTNKDAWVRLAAANALDELDEIARPVLKELYQVLKDHPGGYDKAVIHRTVTELHNSKPETPE